MPGADHQRGQQCRPSGQGDRDQARRALGSQVQPDQRADVEAAEAVADRAQQDQQGQRADEHAGRHRAGAGQRDQAAEGLEGDRVAEERAQAHGGRDAAHRRRAAAEHPSAGSAQQQDRSGDDADQREGQQPRADAIDHHGLGLGARVAAQLLPSFGGFAVARGAFQARVGQGAGVVDAEGFQVRQGGRGRFGIDVLGQAQPDGVDQVRGACGAQDLRFALQAELLCQQQGAQSQALRGVEVGLDRRAVASIVGVGQLRVDLRAGFESRGAVDQAFDRAFGAALATQRRAGVVLRFPVVFGFVSLRFGVPGVFGRPGAFNRHWVGRRLRVFRLRFGLRFERALRQQRASRRLSRLDQRQFEGQLAQHAAGDDRLGFAQVLERVALGHEDRLDQEQRQPHRRQDRGHARVEGPAVLEGRHGGLARRRLRRGGRFGAVCGVHRGRA